ncbi:MAG: hypothetical protein QGI53_00145 [SAR324 cluster bacterium]|nr:hypothetical protein [SAR324 cluster bacterium]MDP6488897.1 hypothetical protein [SAR324 cluster bacterium]MDP7176115.1 hypothetical protein [SAR324 cluster bacterium]MDP7437833.1 hypothetical protein [SAR324 cluster bacterium]MDP7615728.1 hypothetical protein [SAR324 cluster bacterium]
MFSGFPHTLRRYGFDTDVRVLMELYRTMEIGLITNLGSLFDIGQHLICKSRREIAPYTLAFWDHFLGIDSTNYNSIDDAIRNSSAFEHWLSQKLETGKIAGEFDYEKLIDEFLNETLQSDLQANIQQELDARKHLDEDNQDLSDRVNNAPPGPAQTSDKMVDYSKISLEELMERMKRVMEQQKTAHSGGGHWIGSHGFSPYGHSGQGLNGIRVGGPAHAGTARKVLGDPSFYPIDLDAPITDNNMDAALQALRNIEDMHPDRKLNVKRTVEETGRNAGIVIPHFLREQQDRTQVLLLLDNGGNSMWVHAQKVQTLFAKIKRRFPQDLKTFYFHNAVYDQVYEDEARRKPVTLRRIMENSPDYRVFIVGDAYMAPHELLSPFGSIEFREESSTPSLTNLKTLHEHFPYVVWINPTPKQYWNRTVAPYVQKVFKMEPLTINGILEAAKYMNGIKHF